MKFYTLDTALTFGKYEGLTLDLVIAGEPRYINWCIINLDHFYISEEDLDLICQRYPNFKLSQQAQEVLEGKYESLLAQDIDEDDLWDDHFENSRESYGMYAGSYAQDVEGLSDNFINDVLGGEPDAYWNID